MLAKIMNPIDGFFLIEPDDLFWRLSNIMKIPNADFLERTGSAILGARLWRLPPDSACTLHKHHRAEEFYFVVEGTGRIRVEGQTLSVPQHGGVLVGPGQLRQVFNDTPRDVLWLIVGAPEAEFLPGESKDKSVFYPVDPNNCRRNWRAWNGRQKVDRVNSRSRRDRNDPLHRHDTNGRVLRLREDPTLQPRSPSGRFRPLALPVR